MAKQKPRMQMYTFGGLRYAISLTSKKKHWTDPLMAFTGIGKTPQEAWERATKKLEAHNTHTQQ